ERGRGEQSLKSGELPRAADEAGQRSRESNAVRARQGRDRLVLALTIGLGLRRPGWASRIQSPALPEHRRDGLETIPVFAVDLARANPEALAHLGDRVSLDVAQRQQIVAAARLRAGRWLGRTQRVDRLRQYLAQRLADRRTTREPGSSRQAGQWVTLEV